MAADRPQASPAQLGSHSPHERRVLLELKRVTVAPTHVVLTPASLDLGPHLALVSLIALFEDGFFVCCAASAFPCSIFVDLLLQSF